MLFVQFIVFAVYKHRRSYSQAFVLCFAERNEQLSKDMVE